MPHEEAGEGTETCSSGEILLQKSLESWGQPGQIGPVRRGTFGRPRKGEMTQVPEHSPEIEKWLKLIRAEEVGPVTFARLLQRFGSVDAVLGARSAG